MHSRVVFAPSRTTPFQVATLLFFCVLTSRVVSAETKNPELWNWTKEAEHLNCVVQISVGNATATGVVIQVNSEIRKANGFECHILTAYHVVESKKPNESISIQYRNGKQISECEIVKFDDRHDIALLKTWAPKGIKAAKMASDSVQHKMYLEFVGLGGAVNLRKSLRHFSSEATQPTNGNFIYADETLLPGDSGGPVFNKDKELVGIISGGWFWWDAGMKSQDGIPILSTWPARASNLDSIHSLVDDSKQVQIASARTENEN